MSRNFAKIQPAIMSFLLGIFAAIASLLFFGSYAVPLKLPAALPLNPFVFQLYKSTACFLTSWLILVYTPYKFTWWGVLGGLIWVINGIVAIFSVRWAGIGVAQCLWSGLSLFISYIWGAYIFKEPINNHGLSLLALCVMALGMLGVGFSVSNKRRIRLFNNFPTHTESSTTIKTNDEELHDSVTPLMSNSPTSSCKREVEFTDQDKNERDLLKGVLGAVFVGISNGSFMVPLKYAHKDIVGVEYLLSFGIGAMTMTMLVFGIYSSMLSFRKIPHPYLYIPGATLPAFLAGLLWSLGNFFSIYATLYLGLALGWPLVQCQLLVSAMWAVFYYKEVRTKVGAFSLITSSVIVVMGVVMLAQFGSVG